MLEVVQYQQQPLLSKISVQGLARSSVPRFPQAQRLRDGRDHETRVAQVRQGNENRAVWEKPRGFSSRLYREARLAYAASAGQGEQPGPLQEGSYLYQFPFSAQQGCRRPGQVGFRSGRRDGERIGATFLRYS